MMTSGSLMSNVGVIQAILAAGVLVLGFLYLRLRRSLIVDRVLLLGFMAASVVTILAPDSMTWVAHHVGVGRGADLLLYLLFLAGAHVSFVMFMRLAQVRSELTSIVRRLALDQADREYPARDASRDGVAVHRSTASR